MGYEISKKGEEEEINRVAQQPLLPTTDGPVEEDLERIAITPSPHSSHYPQDGTSTASSSSRNDGSLEQSGEASKTQNAPTPAPLQPSVSPLKSVSTKTAHAPSSVLSKLTDSFAFVPIATADATTSPVPQTATTDAATSPSSKSTGSTTTTTTIAFPPATAVGAATVDVSNHPQQEQLDVVAVQQAGKKRKNSNAAVNDNDESPESHHMNGNMMGDNGNSASSGNKKRRQRKCQHKYMKWDDHYALLPAFKAEHGHLFIPASYKTKDGAKLGIWAQNQRSSYSRKQRKISAATSAYTINDHQIEKLNKLGFVWSLAKGMMRPGLLLEICNSQTSGTHGQNKNMASSSSKDYSDVDQLSEENRLAIELDAKAQQQLSARQLAESPSMGMSKTSMENDQLAPSLSPPSCLLISAHRRCSQELEPQVVVSVSRPVANVGDDDDDDNDNTSWNDYYFQLAFFKATREHTNVPSDYVCKVGLELGKWVSRQRTLLSASMQLADSENKALPSNDAVHIEKLREIGFDFDSESGRKTQQSSSDGQQAIHGDDHPPRFGDSSLAAASAVVTCAGPIEGVVSNVEGSHLNNPVELKNGTTRQHEPGSDLFMLESLWTEKNEHGSAFDFLSMISTGHQQITPPPIAAASTGQQHQHTTRQSCQSMPQLLPQHPGAPPGMQRSSNEQRQLTTTTTVHYRQMALMPQRVSNHDDAERCETMPAPAETAHNNNKSNYWQSMMHRQNHQQQQQYIVKDYAATSSRYISKDDDDDDIMVDVSFDDDHNIIVDLSFAK